MTELPAGHNVGLNFKCLQWLCNYRRGEICSKLAGLGLLTRDTLDAMADWFRTSWSVTRAALRRPRSG